MMKYYKYFVKKTLSIDALEADMNAQYGEHLHHYNLRPRRP